MSLYCASGVNHTTQARWARRPAGFQVNERVQYWRRQAGSTVVFVWSIAGIVLCVPDTHERDELISALECLHCWPQLSAQWVTFVFVTQRTFPLWTRTDFYHLFMAVKCCESDEVQFLFIVIMCSKFETRDWLTEYKSGNRSKSVIHFL